jgi:glycosyltransferase involved in cell wall biosynthesis
MRLLFLAGDLSPTNGWGTFSLGYLEQARLRHGSANVHCEPLRSVRADWISLRGLAPDVMRLARIARQCDLVHALIEPAAPLAWLLRRLVGTPYVISAHGTYADTRAYPAHLRPLFRRAFRGASSIVAVSQYTARVARRSFGADLTVDVVPGGCYPKPAAADRSLRDGTPRLLSVGVLKRRKGFHTLVSALGLLARQGQRVRCDIVGSAGSDGYREQLSRQIADAGLADSVALQGRVSAETLDELYANADLFVLASEHDGVAFEGLGLVYLEALAKRVPVIGSRDSGAEDVIRDGENGVLVQPGDAQGLAAAISRLLDDRALRARMQAVAPASVGEFEWNRVGDRMNAVWQKTHRGRS